ncbi:MAG TPA: tRNA (adenosine(37)-N6)-threonylcarbamoyltransferase complex ATPase subunit type 1 TsaE [Acidimicrobiales bacterium]|nr:tRNA (adenosine(37)-N6)-threonylcarbamoyltransferase complex ATPase subunit type 1 TsaE [Acidimicrobiales bacterium]
MIRLRSASPEDTRAIGAAIAAVTRPRDLVLLAGDLGAGKTVFTQGFGAALGVQEPITSPTFTLVRTYPGRVPLVHADVYRLERVQEVIDLGLPELLDEGGGAVAVVEWGDVAAATFAADYLSVRMEFDDDADQARWVTVRGVGPRWAARAESLRESLAPWEKQ